MEGRQGVVGNYGGGEGVVGSDKGGEGVVGNDEGGERRWYAMMEEGREWWAGRG